MKTTFFETCPFCKTRIHVYEEGNGYPTKSKDPIFCPVCHEIVNYKTTRYDFKEMVDSLENTIEPYKSDYQKYLRIPESCSNPDPLKSKTL